MQKNLKKIRYLFEAVFTYLIYFIFWLLPLDMASALGGKIAEFIGPKLKVSSIAYKNLTLVFPKKTEQEKRDIIKKMWNNLGRIAGELPHWSRVSSDEFRKRVKVVREFKELPKEGGVFISAHLGNFELASKLSKEENLGLHLVHRPANNHLVDKLINTQRLRNGIKLFPKGMLGVRHIQKALLERKMIGMLVDQKTNDGIDVPFLGHNAKTTSLPAKLALKYNSAIIFVCFKRAKGATYEITLDKPLKIPANITSEKLTELINNELSSWIIKNPDQWFWVHKRWDK